ncbi:hypothetical protein D3C80_2082030 [compost metagenome]
MKRIENPIRSDRLPDVNIVFHPISPELFEIAWKRLLQFLAFGFEIIVNIGINELHGGF